jgi:hypothetical protein
MLRLASAIDRFTEKSALVFASLIAPLLAAVTWEVVARYAFDAPTSWAYETTYALYRQGWSRASLPEQLHRQPPALDIFDVEPYPDERGIYEARITPAAPPCLSPPPAVRPPCRTSA